MPSSRLEFATFFAGLLVVAALVLVDVRHSRRGDAAPAHAAPATTSVAERTRSILVRSRKTPVSSPAQRAKLATLVLTATRGDCWVSVRAGSSKGADLYEGKLARGQEMRFAKTRLWLRLGAAGNLQATLNGRAVTAFPQGTVDIFVTARGIRPAAAA
jgi:Domain of unknown function (DUF4115)